MGAAVVREVEVMNRDAALRLLRGGPEGIAEWNRRRSAGEEIPDLIGADLSGVNLGGGVNLGWTEIDDRGADLREADLSGATLHGATLHGADLREADLGGADLSKADLGGADLALARCWETVFADVDLSEVKGLDSVEHTGPSTIGIDTLFRSQGKIPEAFLRGCGVPDPWIAYLPSLIGAMSPIQFSSCFISYNTKDEDFAQRLHSRMRDEGLRVWYSPEDSKGGQKLHEQIDQAIRMYEGTPAIRAPQATDRRCRRSATPSPIARALVPMISEEGSGMAAVKSWPRISPFGNVDVCTFM
jgi:hypothetical protein